MFKKLLQKLGIIKIPHEINIHDILPPGMPASFAFMIIRLYGSEIVKKSQKQLANMRTLGIKTDEKIMHTVMENTMREVLELTDKQLTNLIQK